MDYSTVMKHAQEYGIGWLWWCWTGGSIISFEQEDANAIHVKKDGEYVSFLDSNSAHRYDI